MLTPAAALFDRDAVDLQVECGPGTDVTLVTAGATRLNRCDIGCILVNLTANVASGAVLRYLPHELIPFRGARYAQTLHLDLEHDASTLLLEVIAPGRSREPFTYAQLDFAMSVRLAGRLVVRERFTLTSASQAALGGYTHYGSLVALGPEFGPGSADAAHAALSPHGSASALADYGLALKLLGNAAWSMRQQLLCGVGLQPALLRALPP
jgi:urease accessory protein